MLTPEQIQQTRTKFNIQPINEQEQKPVSGAEYVAGLRNYAQQKQQAEEHLNSMPEENKKSLIEKFNGVMNNVLGVPSNFMFGSTAKVAGGFISRGLGSVGALMGKATGNKKMEQWGQGIVDETPTPTGMDVAFSALELYPGGGFVSGALKKMPGSKQVIQAIEKRVMPGLADRAVNLYKSALKPGRILEKAKTDVIKTGLEEGIKVSEKGFDKLDNIIGSVGKDINNAIDIAAKEGKTIDTNQLLDFALQGEAYFKKILSSEDMATKWGDEVVNSIVQLQNKFGQFIPVDMAQGIKRANQNFLSKYYNKEAAIGIEAKKQLTRGIKEEIAQVVPEVQELNAREQKLLELEPFLQKALGRIGNKEVISALDFLVATGGGAFGEAVKGKIGLGGTLLAFKKVLQSPSLKSARAIWYNKLSKNLVEATNKGSFVAATVISRLMNLIKEENEGKENKN